MYLNTREYAHNIAHGNICIADGFIEFAELISPRIEWIRF